MKSIIVVAYLLNNWNGSEFAVAWDYITHMNKNNNLIVLYGCCDGFHKIGNTKQFEDWTANNTLNNVEFIPVKPSFVCHNYDYSTKGNYKFYKEYELWHKDVSVLVKELIRHRHIDLIHFLGPIGYREPGFLYDLNIPYIWGPIGGFGMVNPFLIQGSFSFKGGLSLLLKGGLNKIQSHFNKRVATAIRNSDVVICATSEWKRTVENIAGKNHHSKIFYRPENCINKVYPLNENKFGSTKINLVFVGWIDSRKALILILDALRKVDNPDNFTLNILGDGNLLDKYKEYTSKFHLDSIVNWHGRVPREKVFDIMNKSHLMVLPSLMDANTTVIWEAMAMGIPTLALDHFGFHDTIVNGKTGILIHAGNYHQVINDIASSLNNIQKNPVSLKKMAYNVLEDRSKHLWVDRMKFFEEMYIEAIKNYSKR